LVSLFSVHVLSSASPGETVADVVKGVSSAYRRFRALPHLTINFTLRYERLEGDTNFIFDQARVKTYRSGQKLRLDLDADIFDGSKMRRSYAWDGKVSTGLHAADASSGDYFIFGSKHNNMLFYNYYINFLCYPDGAGSVPSPARRVSSDFLPVVLNDRQSSTSIRGELLDGTECIRFENPAHGAFWFAPGLGYALVRRDVLDPTSGSLHHRTVLHEFRHVDGTWLPSRIVREEFAVTESAGTKPGALLARTTIEVDNLSTEELPESVFRIAAPAGVVVHDTVRSTFFTHYGASPNLVIASAESMRHMHSPSGGGSWLAILAAFLAVCILLCYLLPRLLVRSSVLRWKASGARGTTGSSRRQEQ